MVVPETCGGCVVGVVGISSGVVQYRQKEKELTYETNHSSHSFGVNDSPIMPRDTLVALYGKKGGSIDRALLGTSHDGSRTGLRKTLKLSARASLITVSRSAVIVLASGEGSAQEYKVCGTIIAGCSGRKRSSSICSRCAQLYKCVQMILRKKSCV